MFYNVENLFDTIDSDKADEEFLPGGPRIWNSNKYNTKLNRIYQVIVASAEWSLPPIIGLCEVENNEVLNDLLKYTPLSRRNYIAIYADSYDERGIGVAMLIDTSVFEIESINTVYPRDETDRLMSTRSLLIVRLVNDIDSLSVMVTHWPSRRGGVAVTEPLRKSVAKQIVKEIANIKEMKGVNEKIVIMGDLNCEPNSDLISNDLGAYTGDNLIEDGGLLNLTSLFGKNEIGSYKYQGLWSLFDQIIVSGSLVNSSYGYSVRENSFRVFYNSRMSVRDTRYNGIKPFSTWTGPIYNGGFSDHFPVLIDLEVKKTNLQDPNPALLPF
jgi:endonuclease/exonuclease/phosphatase family metal-dependent hydrolase